MLLSARGTKRKFAFDSDTVENLAREAEEAALRQIEREQAEALKHKLPDFWLPSLTPTYASSGPPASLQDVKLQTTCRAGDPAHHLTCVQVEVFLRYDADNMLSRKQLIPVNFTFDRSANRPAASADSTPANESGQDSKQKQDDALSPMCPSCKKAFSNSGLMFRTSTFQTIVTLIYQNCLQS